MNRPKRPPAFRVGDRIRFNFGKRKVSGVVVEDRGIIGKVAKAKRDQVATFVQSFGLTRPESERVISEVGTGP